MTDSAPLTTTEVERKAVAAAVRRVLRHVRRLGDKSPAQTEETP